MRGGGDAQHGQAVGEFLYIPLHDGAESGVHHRGAETLEFPEFGGDVVGDRGEGGGEFLGEDLGGEGFVGFGDEAVEEADGDGGDTGVAEFCHRGADGGGVERNFDGAVVTDAFGDFEAEVTADQNLGFVDVDVVEVGALLAADFEQIPKTVGGDEAGFRTAVLDQGVGGDGGAVAEIGDGGGGGVRTSEGLGDAGGDAGGGIGGGRGDFPDRDRAGFVVEQADIGEGAAGIDANTPGHTRTLRGQPIGEPLKTFQA